MAQPGGGSRALAPARARARIRAPARARTRVLLGIRTRVLPQACAAALALCTATPAAAWFTIVPGEGAPPKVEAEVRLMFWGVSGGRESADDQDERVRDFFVRRGRLAVRGRASPRLEVYTQFGQDNIGSKVSSQDDGMRVKDFALNYRFREALQVHAGQFKIPFLRSNLESGFQQLLVDRPDLSGLRPAREGTRDVGGMAWGNCGGFQYRAALLDGSDQEDSPRSSPRGAARVSYNWFDREPDLGYTGTRLGEGRTLQIAAQIDAQNDRLDPRDDAGPPTDFTLEPRDYRAWAAEFFYDQPVGKTWAFTLGGAWLDRRDDYEGPALEERRQEGFFAQAGFLLPGSVGGGRLQVAARYERIDSERGSSETRGTGRAFALAFYGKGHSRKIQADYTRRREEPDDADDDQIRLSVVAVF